MRLLLSVIAVVVLACGSQTASAQSLSNRYERVAADSPAPALTPSARADREEAARKSGGISSPLTVFGSLAFVLGLFFVIVWLFRRTSPGMAASLPAEAFEVLGRAALANQQHVRLVRCGTRVLLLSVGPSGADTLAEFTDAAEVDHLVGLCRQSRSAGNRMSQAFRQKESRDA